MNYLWLYAAIVWLTLGYGCSQEAMLPACPTYKSFPMMDRKGEVYAVIDRENVQKLAALIVGLADRKCRLAAPEIPAGKKTGV